MENNLGNLNAIEVCELGQIKVMAKKGHNIFMAGRESIQLANLLKVAVQLYFNDLVIDVYVDTTIESIIKKITSKK